MAWRRPNVPMGRVPACNTGSGGCGGGVRQAAVEEASGNRGGRRRWRLAAEAATGGGGVWRRRRLAAEEASGSGGRIQRRGRLPTAVEVMSRPPPVGGREEDEEEGAVVEDLRRGAEWRRPAGLGRRGKRGGGRGWREGEGASWLGFGTKWHQLIYVSELGLVGPVGLLGLVPTHGLRRAVWCRAVLVRHYGLRLWKDLVMPRGVNRITSNFWNKSSG
jgi:hypothetical protein